MAYVIIFWLGASLIVGIIGMEKKVGFIGAFLSSIILSPIIGLILTLSSKGASTTDKSPVENILDELLNLRDRIARDTKKEIISLSNDSGSSSNKHQIDINSDIYSLWLTSLLIKDDEMKDKFHNHYEIHSDKSQNYLQLLYKDMANHYPKYYDGYNNYIETKNGLVLGGILSELLIDDNHGFGMLGMMSSAKLYALFDSQLVLVIKSIDSLSKKYDISLM